jgi:phage terminase small subunit
VTAEDPFLAVQRVRPVNRIFKARRRVVKMGLVRESPEAPPWLSRPAKSTGRLLSPISAARD